MLRTLRCQLWRSGRMCPSARSFSAVHDTQGCEARGAEEEEGECTDVEDELMVRKRKSLIKELVKEQIREDIRRLREESRARSPKNEEEFIHEKIRRALATIDLNRTEIRRKYSCHLTAGTESLRESEALTPREFEHYKRVARRCKNFASVGKRGVYGGVIHNIHTNWKFHETVRVECPHHNSIEATERIGLELARLSGGVFLEVLEDRTVLLFRGKNYKTPENLYPSKEQAVSRRKAELRKHIELHLRSQVFRLRRYLSRYNMLRKHRECREALERLPPAVSVNSQPVDADPCSDSDAEEANEAPSVVQQLCESEQAEKRREEEARAVRQYRRELARHTPTIRREKRLAKQKCFDYQVRRLGGIKNYLRHIGVPVRRSNRRSYS